VIFTYKPEGQDEGQTWDIDLGKLRSSEMEGIEARTGMDYGSEFKQKFVARNTSARKALLWTLLRRQHHTLLYKDVDFADDEVVVNFYKHEWQEMIDNVAKSKSIEPEEKAERIAILTAAMEESEESLEHSGKAPTPSKKSGPSTD